MILADTLLPQISALSPIIISLNFLFGPLLFLYMCAYVLSNWNYRRIIWLHSLPFLFSITILIPGNSSIISERTIWFVLHCHGVVYAFLTVRLLLGYRKRIMQNLSQYNRDRYTWLLIVVFTYLSTWALALLRLFMELVFEVRSSELLFLTPLLGTLTIYVYGYYSLIHGEILTPDPGSEKMEKQKGKETEERLQELKMTMQLYMEEKKPWKDPGLSLNLLSEQIEIPMYLISKILKSDDKNFFTYVNSYRIRYIQEEMARFNPKDKTILDLAYEAGFGSKSTFNSVFKSQTGLTPSQYKKKVRISANSNHLKKLDD